MKTILQILSSVILSAATPTAFAGHGGGGGGGFGGGFGGGGHVSGGFGGGGARFGGGGGFQPAMSAGSRFAFGSQPIFGRPVMVRPQTGFNSSAPRLNSLSRRPDSVSSIDRRTTNTRSFARANTQRPMESARNHIFARQGANVHRDWDRRSAHFWHRHWWCWDGGAWIGLDYGFYPWDYFPYYAYDYYPYDYYAGYYTDVEPYYNNEAVSDSVPAPDPTVSTVQQDLTKLGYYHGTIDGLYGRTTRDAVAKYQSDHRLIVTGTLTPQTLQSLGVSQVSPS